MSTSNAPTKFAASSNTGLVPTPISASAKPWSIVVLPYGRFSVALPFLVGLGYLFFCIAAFRCDTFEAKEVYDDGSKSLIGRYGYRGTSDSYLYGDEGGKCVAFEWEDKSDWPGAIRAGRAVGIMGGVLGAVTLLLSVYSPFFYIPKDMFKVMGISFAVLMFVFTGVLFFLGLAECGPYKIRDEICDTSIRTPMYLSIAAWVCWLTIIISFICVDKTRNGTLPPVSPTQQEQEQGQASAQYYPNEQQQQQNYGNIYESQYTQSQEVDM